MVFNGKLNSNYIAKNVRKMIGLFCEILHAVKLLAGLTNSTYAQKKAGHRKARFGVSYGFWG